MRRKILLAVIAIFFIFSLAVPVYASGGDSANYTITSVKAPASVAGQDQGQKNVVRFDNGTLIAVWEDVNDDIRCANSHDNGLTWVDETELISGTNQWAAIATNGTYSIIIAEQTDQSDIRYAVSSTDCLGFGAMADAAGLKTSMGEPAIAYDEVQNQWVICAKGSGNDVYFTNATLESEGETWSLTEVENA